jgi:hypothetical protein
MASAEVFRTAETEEALRVMTHIRDLNRELAETILVGPSNVAQLRALQRVEDLPFLLTNFHFDDESFWRNCVQDVPALELPVTLTHDSQLARHLLSVAWHCGHAGIGPRLLLGIARGVGELIATLRFAQLDAIAMAQASAVQRRWADVPEFWARLIETALQGSDEQWSRFQVHALRLLGRQSF